MKKHSKPSSRLPKGAYRLPNGNYVIRRGPITAEHKDPPDYDKLAVALLELAGALRKAEMEVERNEDSSIMG